MREPSMECSGTREDLVASMEWLVTEIVKSLVDRPESVATHRRTEANGTSFVITVAPGDLKLALGPGGRTVASLRTLLDASSRKNAGGFTVEIRSSD